MKRGGIQELRFTRNRWGAILCACALLLLPAAMTAGAAWLALPCPGVVDGAAWKNPAFGWAALSLSLLSLGSFRAGVFLLRRSYIVATALGLDILPLFCPAKRMILIGWNEVNDADLRGSRLVLNRVGAPPLAVPLGSMRQRQRSLLLRLVEGRLQQRREGSAHAPSCR